MSKLFGFHVLYVNPFYAPDGGAGEGGSGDGSSGSGPGEEAGGGNGGAGASGNEFVAPKSKEELDNLIKAATDTALKTAMDTWNKETEKKVSAAVAEAERLAKMTAQEREDANRQKYEKSLEEREKTIALKELELKTVDILKNKNLPLDFKPFVIGNDETTTKERIDTFEKLWQNALMTAVNERLKGRAPGQGAGSGSKELEDLTMEEYAVEYNKRYGLK